MFDSRFGLCVRSALLLFLASCAPARAHTPPPVEDAVVTIPPLAPTPTAQPTAAPEPEPKLAPLQLPAIEVSDEPDAASDLEDQALVIRGLVPGIRRCYENGLKRDPAMSGSLRLSVDVGAQGQVTAVRPVARGFSQEVIDCIVARAKTARFKPPRGGAATITIPVSGDAQ